MKTIEYFKLQAKNLFKDYKTKTPYVDNVDGNSYYKYEVKYFDVDSIVCDFDIDEDDFSLMKAQHIIAVMVGFRKWADLIKASEAELELAKLLFDNQDKASLDDWDIYIEMAEEQSNTTFDSEERLEIFKHVFVNVEGHTSTSADYRLNRNLKNVAKRETPRQVPKPTPSLQITSLPLSKASRAEFIEAANSVFETVLERIEPQNLDVTRELWDAGDYVDNLLTNDMLPISKDYALSLIDTFLVHHVIGLAVQADNQAKA